MVLTTPCPTFPAVRVMHTHRCANDVKESLRAGKIISDTAPVMMGTGRREDRSRTVGLSDTDHFFGYNIQCLIPADPLISGYTAVFIVTVSIRIKVHTFHRVQAAIRRIHHLLPALCVRCHSGTARRRQLLPFCSDRPHIRILAIKIDWRDTYDLIVFDINK